jgi:hypothetical protein
VADTSRSAGYGTRDAPACRTTVAASDATQNPWSSVGENAAVGTSTNGVAVHRGRYRTGPGGCASARVGHLNPPRARRWGAVIEPFRQVREGRSRDVSERIRIGVDNALHADPRTAPILLVRATRRRQLV